MLQQVFSGVLFGTIFIVLVTCQSTSYFDTNCPRDPSGRMRKCKIYASKRLDFNDFREWISRLKDNEKVSLEVSCGSEGTVFLPWPMKAKGLIKLQVSGCTIDGFDSEFNKQTGLKDELQELVVENCVYNSNLEDVFNLIYKPISQDYDCGQQTIHSIVQRNISYAFPGEKQKTLSTKNLKLLMSAGDELIQKSKQKNYRCKYPNLEYIDKSISRTRSKLHLRLMTAYSDYPKLQTFLIADNGYTRIPQELVDWRTSFPQLTYLDMSKNKVVKFNFLGTPFTRKFTRSGPLVVDLSYNYVRVIPLDIEDYLSGTAPIIVDLTGNPLGCNCGFIRYKRYVKEVVKRFPNYKKLSAITCYSTKFRRRLTMSDYIGGNCLF